MEVARAPEDAFRLRWAFRDITLVLIELMFNS
jgi:hypothetical protein